MWATSNHYSITSTSTGPSSTSTGTFTAVERISKQGIESFQFIHTSRTVQK